MTVPVHRRARWRCDGVPGHALLPRGAATPFFHRES